jgi:Flp pilus assembly protein TadD
MAWKKSFRYMRQPAVASVIVIVIALVAVVAVPSMRSRVSSKLNSGATLFLFDDAPTGDPGDPGKDGAQSDGKSSNGFKRVMTAPVRLFARLFKNKDNNELALKKVSEKDAGKMTVIPVSGAKNAATGPIADAANGLAPEVSSAELASKNLFDEAIDLHDKGRLDGAVEKLVAATVMQTNFAEAFNLLAVCYDEKGQYKLAQEEYKKALMIDPNNARFLNNLGYSYYLANDFGNAIKYYTKGLKITPNDRRMHNNVGLAYGRKGDYERAKQHFLVAVGAAGADLNLGYVYSQQGKYEEAIKHYEAALHAQPQSLPALSNLASLYERTGRLREAATLNGQYKKLAVAAQQKDQTVDQDQ